MGVVLSMIVQMLGVCLGSRTQGIFDYKVGLSMQLDLYICNPRFRTGASAQVQLHLLRNYSAASCQTLAILARSIAVDHPLQISAATSSLDHKHGNKS